MAATEPALKDCWVEGRSSSLVEFCRERGGVAKSMGPRLFVLLGPNGAVDFASEFESGRSGVIATVTGSDLRPVLGRRIGVPG